MKAYLNLEDGQSIEGISFGYPGNTFGEVVFSTGMTGYTESLTDPSFSGQILVFTYPLIGNYGVPEPIFLDKFVLKNLESAKIHVKGVVVTEFSQKPSHYKSKLNFSKWLFENKIPAISQIDTRSLTQKIREKGVMMGNISLKKSKYSFLGKNVNYVSETSIKKTIIYNQIKNNHKHIVLIDCGVKHGIIRQLLQLGFKITRIPWNVNPFDVTNKIDAVVISNGPGDPKNCGITISNIQKILEKKIPVLGICLGHQLISLAIGADTYKLKYGHRGLNQPVIDTQTGLAYITSQNHGYAVDTKSLPKNYIPWFYNLNDNTNEGIINKVKKIWSVQFHPEGCPGPFDTNWIFKYLL